MEENYGKLLYEYSDAVSPLDMTKTQRKRHLKSFHAVCVLVGIVLITVWCVWNFVIDLGIYTASSVVKYYALLFVILFIVLLIAVLSVFGLWGKFMRGVTKRYRPHGLEARENLQELQADLKTYDGKKGRENSIKIYENAIVVLVDGKTKFIERTTEYSVTLKRFGGAVLLEFDGQCTGAFKLNCFLPAADVYLLKKYLGDKLTETVEPKPETEKKTDKHKKKTRRNTDCDAKIVTGALVGGIVAVLVGIALALVGHFESMEGMPWGAGFVIMFGVVLFSIAFCRFEIVTVFFLKIAVAAVLIYMGVSFLILFEGAVTDAPVTFYSLLRHPSVYGVCCLFFVDVGVSFIPNAIWSLINYVKYR